MTSPHGTGGARDDIEALGAAEALRALTTIPRVYIAGPMTGIPRYNFPAFDHAAKVWADEWEVVSPADLTRKLWREWHGCEFDERAPVAANDAGGDVYREFLRADIRELLTCDAIALLPGWEKSRGVAVELTVARALELDVFCAISRAPHATAGSTPEAPHV